MNYCILYQKLSKNVGQNLLKQRLSVTAMSTPLPANFECEGDKNRICLPKISLLLLTPYGQGMDYLYLHQ